MSQNPRTRPPARKTPGGSSSQGSQGARRVPNRSAPRRSDPFPLVLGVIIGMLVVGLMAVVYFMASNNSNTPPVAQATATVPTTSDGTDTQPTTPPSDGKEPPRMPLAEFKALYDDPAKRPIIIDVRAKEAFDEGHIKGALSYPEADIDAMVVKLPKDKPIIAYCQ